MVDHRRIMVAITGASGMLYARRLLEILPQVYDRIYLVASDNALDIMRDELGVERLVEMAPSGDRSKFSLFSSTDLHAPPASGSHFYEGMVIVPCSMGVVGRIASGISNDLVTRAADVCLKEKRKLILVVRETPLSLIHLRNLTTLAEAGAVVLPAAPAFYAGAKSIGDLLDFVIDRVLCTLGEGIRLVKGWGD
ncbi:MAG: UbiX family flavin prenyltransferase [Armatimonadetes bacterium]|nr:UbiX family flavin prenyltransferase [Armatimonadota bacterium]